MRAGSLVLAFTSCFITAAPLACSDARDDAQSTLAQELRRFAPTITSVSPASGPATGGTTVDIAGSNFRDGMAVTFGGVAATSVSLSSTKLLRVTAPPHAAGAVDVVVKDSRNRTATARGAFTYVAASESPDAGTTAPPPPPPSTSDAGAQPFVAPTLVNPVSPIQFGAKCDGVTDDSAAFQAAVNAGDVKVPAATCVINHPVNITMSDRHIECAAGGVIKQTDPYAGRIFNILSFSGATLTGDSIVGCEFVGANTEAPQYYETDNRHWNIPVQTQDRVSNFLLAGNTFRQFFGQSMFQTYGQVDGGSGDVIVYNTFKSCGYYGPVLVAHKNGLIAHNTLVDCSLGVENDDAQQVTGGNVIEYNTLTGVHGYGAAVMQASVLLTGGAAGNANYSTNIVRYNTVSGVSDALGFQGAGRPSKIYIQSPGGAAQYIGNVCGDGCVTIY